MTNTIQQLKEEMIDELDKAGHLALYSSPEAVRKAIDKVIKDTADAMVGEELKRVYDGNNLEPARVHYHRAFQNWYEVVRYEDGYNTRIAEEKALRDEITQ